MTTDYQWYIGIKGKIRGPFSTEELVNDPRFCPDLYVWRAGFAEWQRVKDVAELSGLSPVSEKEEGEKPVVGVKIPVKKPAVSPIDDEIVMDFWSGPPFFILFILLSLLLMIIYFYSIS